MNKELQSPQVKRRRMLQFDNEVLESPFCNEEMASVFLKSKVGTWYKIVVSSWKSLRYECCGHILHGIVDLQCVLSHFSNTCVHDQCWNYV